MSSPDLRWILSHHLEVFPGGACVHQARRRMKRIVLAVFWTGAPVGSQGRIFGTSPLVSVPPLDRPARTEGTDGPHPSLGLPIASLVRDPCARVEHGLSLVTFSLGFVLSHHPVVPGPDEIVLLPPLSRWCPKREGQGQQGGTRFVFGTFSTWVGRPGLSHDGNPRRSGSVPGFHAGAKGSLSLGFSRSRSKGTDVQHERTHVLSRDRPRPTRSTRKEERTIG